ncbi:hypothetical protein MKX79_05955 [Viridibacillus sp. FSL R5-0468]|uniref:hypothetical protein n=1 Tax=Viridibacillus sp. FSL R5-0468 TaxID=2921640 RepID=UPI0004B3F444
MAELQELEEEQRLSNIQSHLLKEQSRQLEQMQKQIDLLTYQMSKMDRRKK